MVRIELIVNTLDEFAKRRTETGWGFLTWKEYRALLDKEYPRGGVADRIEEAVTLALEFVM